LQLALFYGIAIVGLIVLGRVLWGHYPLTGYGFLYFFEWFAQTIGAAVDPVPPEVRYRMMNA